MTATALLDQNPNPSEHDIKVALKDTFCRCAGYPTIIRAIQSAAALRSLYVKRRFLCLLCASATPW